MSPGMAIPLRRARIRAPVHTAPLAPLHGWGLALRSRTGPRQAARGRCQPLRLHGIDRQFFHFPAPDVDVLGNDSLPAAIIDMDMAHHLFSAAPHPGQRLHLPLRGAQQLCGEVAEHLRSRHPFR